MIIKGNSSVLEFSDKSMIKYKELSDTILKRFYEVYNELGRGFLESVYREALMITLQEAGLNEKKKRKSMCISEINMLGDLGQI